MPNEMLLRIGELSRRTGITPELLRAWERRYGLLRPRRSGGGLRLYQEADVQRVNRMQQHISNGLAAAEAAALAIAEHHPARVATHVGALPQAQELRRALESFDEPRAQELLDALLTAATVDTLLPAVVLPYLQELGERWARGEITVAQEHFATSILRGRLMALARGWGRGVGPRCLLACPPGEQHDVGLVAFGLLLRSRGWRVAYLGADTPIDTLEETAAALRPDAIVLSSVDRSRFEAIADALGRLATDHRLALGGAGARDLDLAVAEALVLDGDVVEAADALTERVAR